MVNAMSDLLQVLVESVNTHDPEKYVKAVQDLR